MERYYKNRRGCYISKKRQHLTLKSKIIILLVLTVFSSFFLLEILDRKLTPIIKNYIDSEAERIVSSIVNTSVNELVGEDITRDLFNIKKNNNDEIQLITYNTKMVNS